MAALLLSIITAQSNTEQDFSKMEQLTKASFEKINAIGSSIVTNAQNMWTTERIKVLHESLKAIHVQKKARYAKLARSNELLTRITVPGDLTEVISGANFRGVTNVFITESLGTTTVSPDQILVSFGTVLLGEDKLIRTIYINNQTVSQLNPLILPVNGDKDAFHIAVHDSFVVPSNFTLGIDIILKKQSMVANLKAEFDIGFPTLSKSVHVFVDAVVHKPDLELSVESVNFGSLVSAPDKKHKYTLNIQSKFSLLLKTQIQEYDAKSMVEVSSYCFHVLYY